jgi:hypothetical protein
MRLARTDTPIRYGTSSGSGQQVGLSVLSEALVASSPSSGNHWTLVTLAMTVKSQTYERLLLS